MLLIPVKVNQLKWGQCNDAWREFVVVLLRGPATSEKQALLLFLAKGGSKPIIPNVESGNMLYMYTLERRARWTMRFLHNAELGGSFSDPDRCRDCILYAFNSRQGYTNRWSCYRPCVVESRFDKVEVRGLHAKAQPGWTI